MMEEKSLKKLEFDKICQMLAQRASSLMGKELAAALVPETDLWVIERLQDETEEGFQMLVRQGEPPFGGIRDIRGLLQRSSVGGLLSMGELLMVQIPPAVFGRSKLREKRRRYAAAPQTGSVVCGIIQLYASGEGDRAMHSVRGGYG